MARFLIATIIIFDICSAKLSKLCDSVAKNRKANPVAYCNFVVGGPLRILFGGKSRRFLHKMQQKCGFGIFLSSKDELADKCLLLSVIVLSDS